MNPSISRNTIRTFVAIPIPKNISLFLNKIQGEIRENQIKASWVRTSSMHLTLRFIKETANEDVAPIIHAMKATAVTCAPFTLSAGGVGGFPDIKKARVIWSGVRGQMDSLKRVQLILEKNLGRAGLQADKKRFSPHVTLGRFKDRKDSMTLANIIENFEPYESDPCLMKKMVLFKSDLKPSGAVHTPLFEVEFAGIV
ncbi:MAG: RNA 2',3'-cyclic phosphodiesterase [Pseudomonadota bacterium]